MSTRTLVFLLLLRFVFTKIIDKEYCVVGAGPAGLQLGHFFQSAGRDYVVLEKSHHCGSFYDQMPRHGQLISINKRHTDSQNTEYCLRHDWNSLLSDDPSLLFKHYSKEFLPKREDMVRYLNDFQQKLNISVQFNTTVKTIQKQPPASYFTLLTDTKLSYHCQVVVMATGLSEPDTTYFKGSEYTVSYANMSINQSDYEGKRVLIIGKGNSAFETAQHIYGNTALVHMIGRHTVRLAWSTHYVGDLRAVNNGLLDTYQLKSLDGLYETDGTPITLSKSADGRIYMGSFSHTNMSSSVNEVNPNNLNLYYYDIVIRATGWKWNPNVTQELHINSTKNPKNKYPKISYNYESSQVNNIFFAGTMTHSLDFRQSAGGFIHGFRYTARALHRYLEFRRHQITWPVIEGPIENLLDAFVKRINEGSGNYQMFSNLGDVILLNKEKNRFKLLMEFPIKALHTIERMSGHKVESDLFVFIFEYGRNFSGPRNDVFGDERANCESDTAYRCNFLHPIIYHFNNLPTQKQMYSADLKKKNLKLPEPQSLLHLKESFFTFFRDIEDVQILTGFLENVIRKPLTPLSMERCIVLSMTHQEVPDYCAGPLSSAVKQEVFV